MFEFKVLGTQNVSRMCAVCGRENEWSLRARFFNMEGGWLLAQVQPIPEHQSYPGRMHGGVGGAIIDEVVGRAVNSLPEVLAGEAEEAWGVTMDLTTRYRRPPPYDQPLCSVERITKKTRRMMEGEGFLYAADGTLCLEGHARYLKQPGTTITDDTFSETEWFPDPEPAPATVQLPAGPAFLRE